MTALVVDASALVAAIQGRPRAIDALARGALAAPELLTVETLSALRGLERAGAIEPAAADVAAAGLERLAIRLVPHGELAGAIWALRHELSAYAASYLALAELLGGDLITADGPLADRAEARMGRSRVRRL